MEIFVLALQTLTPEDRGESHLTQAADVTKEDRAGEEDNSCHDVGGETLVMCKCEMFSMDP